MGSEGAPKVVQEVRRRHERHPHSLLHGGVGNGRRHRRAGGRRGARQHEPARQVLSVGHGRRQGVFEALPGIRRSLRGLQGAEGEALETPQVAELEEALATPFLKGNGRAAAGLGLPKARVFKANVQGNPPGSPANWARRVPLLRPIRRRVFPTLEGRPLGRSSQDVAQALHDLSLPRATAPESGRCNASYVCCAPRPQRMRCVSRQPGTAPQRP